MGDEFAKVVKTSGAQGLEDEGAGSLSLETHHDGQRAPTKRTLVFLARTRYCCSGPSGFFSAILRLRRRKGRGQMSLSTRKKSKSAPRFGGMRRCSSPSLLSEDDDTRYSHADGLVTDTQPKPLGASP